LKRDVSPTHTIEQTVEEDKEDSLYQQAQPQRNVTPPPNELPLPVENWETWTYE